MTKPMHRHATDTAPMPVTPTSTSTKGNIKHAHSDERRGYRALRSTQQAHEQRRGRAHGWQD